MSVGVNICFIEAYGNHGDGAGAQRGTSGDLHFQETFSAAAHLNY
jgi:hypothetical protein